MSKPHLTTAAAVIDRLGGIAAVADLTGRRTPPVYNWRYVDAFPSNTYVALTEALKAIGETAPDVLWGMVASTAPENASAA